MLCEDRPCIFPFNFGVRTSPNKSDETSRTFITASRNMCDIIT